MTLRPPSVAGTFYPGRPRELRSAIESYWKPAQGSAALAVIVPHAGYRYSGPVAGAAYSAVSVPRDVVLLCFHHRGRGAPFAIWPPGAWATPLGEVPVQEALARRIREAFPLASFDEEGHRDEHSGEVQLPFLQVARPDVRIVPVALSVGLSAAKELADFGRALAGVLRDELVVCSTDLNHYEDQETTLAKDRKVIEPMEALDDRGLTRAIVEEDVSMCGFAPAIATLAYAKARGARRGETLVHQTSGDTGGDYDRCVGYVGMRICGN